MCLFLFPSSLSFQIFPRRKRNFTSEAICSWVFEHLETVLQWMQPPGTKSRLLEHELNKGPALLLFLPHNPLGSKPNAVLQQVGTHTLHIYSWGHRIEEKILTILPQEGNSNNPASSFVLKSVVVVKAKSTLSKYIYNTF